VKNKYAFHPNQYELGENEQFYSKMEERGWRLVKRGVNLSKFEPVEPSRARYRIEIFHSGIWSVEDMPEEQLAVFEDCGWELAAVRAPLHIFRAPEGSSAPEFYMEPQQQAETLKKMKREAVWGWLPGVLIYVLYLLTICLLQGGRIRGQFQKALIYLPPLYFLAGLSLLAALYERIRSAWIITRTYRRLKKGVPLDHNPRKNRWLHRAISGVLWGLVLFSGILLAVQLIGNESYDMPLESDGPYILVQDLGIEGERVGFMDHTSGVKHSRSLLTDYWDTEEYIFLDEDTSCFIDQEIYRLRDEKMAYWLAEALMETALFGANGENFAPVETAAVDAAWTSHGLEVVAVKGRYVAYVVQTGWGVEIDAPGICRALAARWGQ